MLRMLAGKMRMLPWALAGLALVLSTLDIVRAGEPRAETFWKQTAELAAPEAHQAAAADGDFVYAISNQKIARYDRKSGRRLDTSGGAAEHLNSGFVWQGFLYCAHSNYPDRPEHSEIKRLDLATMRLDTFHDFGASEGSLTWAVRHRDAWWCNFAFYERGNAKTYLARFDNEWHEVARWRYPAEVIAELGTRSISGGIWQGDELLVTGHDEPVIYRLRLPDRGDMLVLVAKERSPFPGQGIAHDPQTGGLVGIDRRRKCVIFAEQQP